MGRLEPGSGMDAPEPPKRGAEPNRQKPLKQDSTKCPECNATAWVVDRYVLEGIGPKPGSEGSAPAIVEMVRLRCFGPDKHHLNMPSYALTGAG